MVRYQFPRSTAKSMTILAFRLFGLHSRICGLADGSIMTNRLIFQPKMRGNVLEHVVTTCSLAGMPLQATGQSEKLTVRLC
jgi:hypothetical protein